MSDRRTSPSASSGDPGAFPSVAVFATLREARTALDRKEPVMDRATLSTLFVVACTAAAAAQPATAPYVLVDSRDVVATATLSQPGAAQLAGAGSCPVLEARAWNGQALSGGGTLQPITLLDSTTLDASGRVAFHASVLGSPRNQGVFLAGPNGVVSVARGCGASGGGNSTGTCGDPTPIGGTFSGFFGGTFFTPATNDAGDVLFLADVHLGSAKRGLFLYRAATGLIQKVAAIGDATPTGGTFGAIGPGSVNSSGTVVFLASKGSGGSADVFRWHEGALSKVVAVGDPAPLGGTFFQIGTESLGFADGTTIPVGPVPAINDLGQVTFRGGVSGGIAQYGLFLSSGGVHQWLVRTGGAAPGGGTFVGLQAAAVNDAGEIAFFADIQTGPGQFSSAWYGGKANALRRVLGFFDVLDDGAVCMGLAFSRNPLRSIDEQGNIVVWTDAQLPNGSMQNRYVIGSRDGVVKTVIRSGMASPLGGTLGQLQPWLSIDANDEIGVSATLPGSAAGDGHLVASRVLTWFDVGLGKSGSAGIPKLAGKGALVAGASGALELTSARPNAAAALFLDTQRVDLPLLGGTLVPGLSFAPFLATTNAGGEISIPWLALPSLPPCLDLYFQWWIADSGATLGAAASNGLRGLTQ